MIREFAPKLAPAVACSASTREGASEAELEEPFRERENGVLLRAHAAAVSTAMPHFRYQTRLCALAHTHTYTHTHMRTYVHTYIHT